MDDEQEGRKRKLAELKARREQSKRANATLAAQERGSRPPIGGLPGPDDEYAASVFGQAGGDRSSMDSSGGAAPLVVGWGTGDARYMSVQPSGSVGAPPARGHLQHQQGPSTYPGPPRGAGPGFPPPPPRPPPPFGATPRGLPNSAWRGAPRPPPGPVAPGHSMGYFIPGDPRGGNRPPSPGFHGMPGGHSAPGMQGRGGGTPGARGPRGQWQHFRQPPQGNPGVRNGGGHRGAGARDGRQQGRGGGFRSGRGGRQGGRGGFNDNNGGGEQDGFFKPSFVEDPWKNLLSNASRPTHS